MLSQDNLSEIVKEGGVQKLIDGDYIVQASEDCKQKTQKRLEEKMQDKARAERYVGGSIRWPHAFNKEGASLL